MNDSQKKYDFLQAIHTIETDHIEQSTVLRKDLENFTSQILDAMQTLTSRVEKLENKVENSYNNEVEKRLSKIEQNVSEINAKTTEIINTKAKSTNDEQPTVCNNVNFIETLIELTAQISRVEGFIQKIGTDSPHIVKENGNNNEKNEQESIINQEKIKVNVETENKYELLQDIDDDSQETPVVEKESKTHVHNVREEQSAHLKSKEGKETDRKTTQKENAKNTKINPPYVDLWIVGSSITRNIIPTLMYKSKIVKVTTLKDKTIQGAISCVKTENIRPKVLLLQIGSNDLNRMNAETALREYENLIVRNIYQIPK